MFYYFRTVIIDVPPPRLNIFQISIDCSLEFSCFECLKCCHRYPSTDQESNCRKARDNEEMGRASFPSEEGDGKLHWVLHGRQHSPPYEDWRRVAGQTS